MNNVVVVDASVAIKWVLDEPYSIEARQLLVTWSHYNVTVLAPALLAPEVTNALYQRVRRGQMEPQAAHKALDALLATNIFALYQEEIAEYQQSLMLSMRFELRASYDACYLAFAKTREAQLWTADERLWNTVKDQFPWVRWIAQP